MFFDPHPIYYTLIMSLNDGKDAMQGGIYWCRGSLYWTIMLCFKNTAIFNAFMITSGTL